MSAFLLFRDPVPETELNVEGLLEGLTYIFRVAAENQAGPGKFSVASEPMTARSPICKSFNKSSSFCLEKKYSQYFSIGWNLLFYPHPYYKILRIAIMTLQCLLDLLFPV